MLDHSKPSPAKSSWPETIRAVGPYMALGWMFVILVGAGVWGGSWADARFGTEPWMLLLGAFVGIALSLYYFIATALQK